MIRSFPGRPLGGNTNSLMTAIDQTPDTNSESHRLAEVARTAHELVGCNACWGVEAFTRPLRELERLAHAGDLSGAHALLTDVRQRFPRVQSAFTQLVQTLPTSNS